MTDRLKTTILTCSVQVYITYFLRMATIHKLCWFYNTCTYQELVLIQCILLFKHMNILTQRLNKRQTVQVLSHIRLIEKSNIKSAFLIIRRSFVLYKVTGGKSPILYYLCICLQVVCKTFPGIDLKLIIEFSREFALCHIVKYFLDNLVSFEDIRLSSLCLI